MCLLFNFKSFFLIHTVHDVTLFNYQDEAKEEELEAQKGWWHQFLENEEDLEKVELGSKMILLLDILRECELMGDKVLVFSQSLLSLDLIEDFLQRIAPSVGKNSF